MSGTVNPYISKQISSGLTYGDLSVLEQSRLLADFSYGGSESMVLGDIVQSTFSSQLIKDRLSEIDDASLIQAMTSLTREIPREASLREELLRGRKHLPDAGYGELTRRMTESGGIERLARVAAGIGSPYASQDLVTKALNAEISRSTARQGLVIGSERAIALGAAAGPDPFRFVKHSEILSELGISYFQPNTKARFLGQSTGLASTGQSITQSKILATNTMSQNMMVRYRDEAGLLQEARLFDLARTNPGAVLVRQDITDAAGALVPLGGAVTDQQLTNVTAGSLNKVRLSRVSNQDQGMFNIYMAGHGATTEEAEILADSLIQAARSEITDIEARLLDMGEVADLDPVELEHLEKGKEELTNFLSLIDSPGVLDEEGKNSRERLVEAIQSQRSFDWYDKW